MPGNPSLLAGNMLIGGLTAGIERKWQGGSFWSSFVKGAGGGAIVFAGKRVISEEGSANAWAGRQLAALGASEVRNIAAGKHPFEEITIPLGPTRFVVSTGQRFKVAPRIDLATVLVAIQASSRNATSFSVRESLSNGTLVFLQPVSGGSAGSSQAGVVIIDDIPPSRTRTGKVYVRSGILAHETIHASQYDFVSTAWGLPVEKWLLNKTSLGRRVGRYVDFGIVMPVWGLANIMSDHDARPWEKEAISLAPGG